MDDIQVGMVSGQSRLDDSAFLFSAWSGLRELGEQPGIRTSILEAESDEQMRENARYLAYSGYRIVWAMGYVTRPAVEYIAPKFPDCTICAVDMSFDELPGNVIAVRFDEHKGSFLAGYLAARVSRERRVGFVGGERSDLIGRFEAGFRAGVPAGAAARPDRGDVAVEVTYTDSFVSYHAGRAAANRLFDAGCDVVFHAAGGAGRGVIRSAGDRNRLVIGVDKDQSFLAPANVVSSMIKRIDTAVVSLSRSVLDGTVRGGREVTYGIGDGAIYLVDPANTGDDEAIRGELQIVSKRIESGEITVPATPADF